jgi:hypothetical protein
MFVVVFSKIRLIFLSHNYIYLTSKFVDPLSSFGLIQFIERDLLGYDAMWTRTWDKLFGGIYCLHLHI